MNEEIINKDDVDMKENNIYNSNIKEKIDEIVKKLRVNKFSLEEKEILYNIIQKVLLNEHTKKNKNMLLNVIEKVNCYKDAEIIEFINASVQKIIKNSSENKYIIIKERISSSNHSMVSNLIKYGFIESENILILTEEDSIIKFKEIKEIKENSIILIVDDYVGSGKTVIDILKLLEKDYKNQYVKIVSYIWQEKAIQKVNKYINEDIRNNRYEIYNENIIIENAYSEKCKEEPILLEYIRNTCCTCAIKRLKYGYNKTGAMITINGLSPNNNISMLWRDDLGDNQTWLPPFNRDINMLSMEKKKEKIIKESYVNMINYYNDFYFKDIYNFDEFKMLLLLFNSYCININQITKLLGVDTNEDAEMIIAKFKQYGIIKYEVDNILEFIDKNVIKQFKKINQQISRYALDGLDKKCTSNF